jgi:uncharacterized membrane protein (DUF2068 family)
MFDCGAVYDVRDTAGGILCQQSSMPNSPVDRPRPRPQAVDERASVRGLRAVATFEALKGVIVLLLGLGILGLLHKDAEAVAESLLMHLHINPDRRLSHALINAATRMTDAGLWMIFSASIVYAGVRFTEAWGLWNRRVWAEWFALLSGTLYLPWEIFKVVERSNWLHLSVFLLNIAILLYILYIRIAAYRHPA